MIYYFSSFQHQVKQEVQGLTYLYLRCGTLTLPYQRRIPTQALSMCIHYIFFVEDQRNTMRSVACKEQLHPKWPFQVHFAH